MRGKDRGLVEARKVWQIAIYRPDVRGCHSSSQRKEILLTKRNSVIFSLFDVTNAAYSLKILVTTVSYDNTTTGLLGSF